MLDSLRVSPEFSRNVARNHEPKRYKQGEKGDRILVTEEPVEINPE
jgi:hypothetical protein